MPFMLKMIFSSLSTHGFMGLERGEKEVACKLVISLIGVFVLILLFLIIYFARIYSKLSNLLTLAEENKRDILYKIDQESRAVPPSYDESMC